MNTKPREARGSNVPLPNPRKRNELLEELAEASSRLLDSFDKVMAHTKADGVRSYIEANVAHERLVHQWRQAVRNLRDYDQMTYGVTW